MKDEDRRAILGELFDAHSDALPAAGPRNEALWAEVDRALALLPDAGEWAIARHVPAVLVRSGETRFTILVRDDRVVVQSRSLSGNIAVALAFGDARRTDTGFAREWHWTFRYPDDEDEDEDEDDDEGAMVWRNITGTVTTDDRGGQTPDRNQRIARHIAERAGWDVGTSPGESGTGN